MFDKNIKDLKKRLLLADYPKSLIRLNTYQFKERRWLIEKQPQTDKVWYYMDNTRHSHEKWNFIQNSMKPLFKCHNVQLTAKKGTTTLDAINKTTKQVLQEPKERKHQKRQ